MIYGLRVLVLVGSQNIGAFTTQSDFCDALSLGEYVSF